jgi:hypothetical protein
VIGTVLLDDRSEVVDVVVVNGAAVVVGDCLGNSKERPDSEAGVWR